MQQALAPAIHSSSRQDNEQHIPQGYQMAQSTYDTPMSLDHQDPMSSGGDNSKARNNSNSINNINKRELSTSKRAAQNRAAQRAFRQRKEGHIKKLEEQVREYQLLSENYKAVQAENYQLRDYIINLQSRLIESQGDYPPAPGNIDLRQPLQPAATGLSGVELGTPAGGASPTDNDQDVAAALANAAAESSAAAAAAGGGGGSGSGSGPTQTGTIAVGAGAQGSGNVAAGHGQDAEERDVKPGMDSTMG